jgi:hypothetical protein
MPADLAAQASTHGQIRQFAVFGEQTVAPRSIRACAKSPGRSGGTSSSVAALMAGLDAGNGSVMARSREMTRSTLPSTAAAGRLKAMAAIAAAV